jgi:hypothetical protein
MLPVDDGNMGCQYFFVPAGVVAGAIVGGIVGALINDTDEFDFLLIDPSQRELGAERMLELDRR